MNAYDRTQKIDDYLENNMSIEEKKEFERLLSDPSASLGGSMNLNVKEEVKMQKAIIQEIQRRALRSTLMDENRKYRARQRIIPKIVALSSSISATAIAAVMVIMFVISPMATLLKDSSAMYVSEIQMNYSSHTLIDNQSRGVEDFIFNAKCHIADNEWKQAKKELRSAYKEYFNEGVSNIQDLNLKSCYYDYLWLRALCEIQTGHVYKAKRILTELKDSNSANYKEKAKQILETLNDEKYAN